MRTETDKFNFGNDGSHCIEAMVDTADIVRIELVTDWTYLTKKQAAEFARQILEMCEEDE